MKRLIYILIFIVTIGKSNAQSNTKSILRQANKQMSMQKYAYAIPLYKYYLLNGSKDSMVYKNLGQAYKMVNQFDSAIVYYKIAAKAGLVKDNTIPELEASLGNYKNAQKGYEEVVENHKSLLADARLYGFKNLNKFYEDSLDYHIYYTKVNSQFNDFNAVPYKDGLIFESNRVWVKKGKWKKSKIKPVNAEFSWDGNAFTNLYYLPNVSKLRTDSLIISVWNEKKIIPFDYARSSVNDNRKMDLAVSLPTTNIVSDTSLQIFSPTFFNKFNTGAISFTQDFQKAYYTRNGNKTKNGYMLEIWETYFINGKWIKGRKLFFKPAGNR